MRGFESNTAPMLAVTALVAMAAWLALTDVPLERGAGHGPHPPSPTSPAAPAEARQPTFAVEGGSLPQSTTVVVPPLPSAVPAAGSANAIAEIYELARRDPANAARSLLQFQASDDRDVAIVYAVAQWAAG